MPAALRHLAVFAACYVAAQVVAAAVLAGVRVPWQAVIVAGLTGLGTYLVDRSGPWPGKPDRGDLRAEPDRVRFLRKYDLQIRATSVFALVTAFVLSLPWGVYATLVPLSVIGLLCYSHGAVPGRRLKDRLWFKNPTVAGSITALAVALVVATSDANWYVFIPVAAVLLLRITADAMRCDIDDAESDARQGTRTIANMLGVGTTWRLALCLDVAAAGVALTAAAAIGWRAAVSMGCVPLLAGLGLTLWRPRRSRDLVDAAGALSVLVAWWLALT